MTAAWGVDWMVTLRRGQDALPTSLGFGNECVACMLSLWTRLRLCCAPSLPLPWPARRQPSCAFSFHALSLRRVVFPDALPRAWGAESINQFPTVLASPPQTPQSWQPGVRTAAHPCPLRSVSRRCRGALRAIPLGWHVMCSQERLHIPPPCALVWHVVSVRLRPERCDWCAEVWINVGPLNWRKEARMKLNWDEVLAIWKGFGPLPSRHSRGRAASSKSVKCRCRLLTTFGAICRDLRGIWHPESKLGDLVGENPLVPQFVERCLHTRVVMRQAQLQIGRAQPGRSQLKRGRSQPSLVGPGRSLSAPNWWHPAQVQSKLAPTRPNQPQKWPHHQPKKFVEPHTSWI